MIVPFAPGGASAVTARIIANHMRTVLGQSVIVENVAGAAGNIGTGRVARSAPDGYTLIFGQWGTHVINGAIYPLQYDVLRDFEPIALISSNPWLIVARKTAPADDLISFIAWLKANPDKLSQGTAGAGAASHIAGLFFQRATGTRFQFVPYRGGGPAMQDLVAGRIDLMVDTPVGSVPQVRAGTIKAFAVTAKDRLAALPAVPTVDEAGVPGLYVSFWQAMWAPRGTPKDITSKLNSAAMTSLADSVVRQRLSRGFRTLVKISIRLNSKPLMRSLPSTKLRLKSGDQFSRLQTSKVSEPGPGRVTVTTGLG
jgi:tripartite-type tricarboxylate transporter receptor subunit TctC